MSWLLSRLLRPEWKMNVRAIELGFGTTSFVASEKDGIPVIKTFPSIVSQVDKISADLSAGLNRRDTVRVQLKNESVYEVGPDAGLVSDRTASRIINNSYIDSDNYKALLFGCLNMMDCDSIDLLVLGVPVTSWHRVDELKKLVIGSHTLNGKTLTVHDAWVIVQPLAGLLSYAYSNDKETYQQMRDMNILSVDIGYGTADYLFSRGLQPNEARSGAIDAGMGSIISAVAGALKTAFPRIDRIPNEIIDAAFWKHPGVLKISGKRYPFPLCQGKTADGEETPVHFNLQPQIDQITRNAVTQIRNTAGSGADIDMILLFGGPAQHYKDALQNAYPDHYIITPSDNEKKWQADSLTVVCEGLYRGGVQYAQARARKRVAG